MRFSYSYKTSDGVRHEDVLEAGSRDEAFAVLRGRGIRAIKVVSLEGTKANGEIKIVVRKRLVAAALVLGIAVGIGATVFCLMHDFRDPRLIRLEAGAAAILERHDRMVATLHLEALRDYKAIRERGGDWILNEKISVGHQDLRMMRVEIRELFKKAVGLPGASEAYHRVMDAVDLTEARLSNDEKAFRLLDGNRGKWSVTTNGIAWSDARLEAEFRNYSRDLGD